MKKESISGQTILVVHANNFAKRFTFQKIKKMGVKIVCLHREKASWAIPYVDHWIIADLNDHKESLQAIKSFTNQNPNIVINGALTFWDEAVLLTSKIIDTFGFVGIPYHVARITKNKFLFRDFCAKNGILYPKHKLLRSKSDIPKIEKQLTYPVVVKPIYGASSAFVIKVENRQEFEDTYDYIKSNIKSYELAPEWNNLELFVEEYIDGDEVDIDILLQNGKIKFYCISDNYNKSRDRFFVDSGQAIPSSLPEKTQEDLIKMADETLEKLGIQNGCIHFEAKSTSRGPIPIEINMRMGGDYIYSYIKGAWGVDLVEYIVKIALGQFIKIEQKESPKKYIIGWDLQPESSGILVELEVSKELNKKKYLEATHIVKEIGDPILRPPEGYDSMGWITVSGENMLDAQDNLREALGFIKYKIAEFDEESSLGKTSRKNSLSVAVLKKDLLIQAAKLERVKSASFANQRNLHIGLATNIYNNINPVDAITTKLIEKKLTELGYITTIFDFNNLKKTLFELPKSNVDIVFNISYGINNNEFLKPQVAALLESLGIPYTGSNSFIQALCRDKIRVKKLFTYHTIPTPKWDYAYTSGETIDEKLVYPLIVKPSNSDNSFGINTSSVVQNKRQLTNQIKKVTEELRRPALVEEFIDGDEYEVSILGNYDSDLRVLPICKSVFKAKTKGKFTKTTSFKATKNLGSKLEALITEIAIDAYKIMHCNDYGKVGIRVDDEGNPYVLEVDTNPSLSEQSGFVYSAKLANIKYADLLEEIIRLAIKRYRDNKSILH